MSKLEVDKVTPQSGTTLTIGEAGDTTVINGLGTLPATIGSATQVLSVNAGATGLEYGTAATDLSNLNATNLTSGTVPDGRFPSVLPAAGAQNLTSLQPAAIVGGTFGSINAANLTNLNATALTSGTVPDARFPATLPAISGANLTNLPASGITEADWWRITTEFNGSATPIASNWERCDSAGFGKIGTGVSQSSGVFSFPSTGVWQMLGQQGMYYSGSIRYARLDLETTVDNTSNWVTSGSRYSFINNVSNNTYSGMNCNIIFNCSNISTHKFRMSIVKENESVTTTATSASTQTGCMFIRLGDSV